MPPSFTQRVGGWVRMEMFWTFGLFFSGKCSPDVHYIFAMFWTFFLQFRCSEHPQKWIKQCSEHRTFLKIKCSEHFETLIFTGKKCSERRLKVLQSVATVFWTPQNTGLGGVLNTARYGLACVLNTARYGLACVLNFTHTCALLGDFFKLGSTNHNNNANAYRASALARVYCQGF